jgi:tRNA (uracil-5-)-methyltransferase TRM9
VKESTAKKLLTDVTESYNLIANEFSDTRAYSWEEFDFFKPYLFENAEILDLGCGNGRLINFLDHFFLGNHYRYLGIDNSENLLDKAHQQFPDKVFIPGDQLNIPVESHQVDVLFDIAAFHHLPSRDLRIQALMEMKRVLKPRGVLIISVWNLWQKKYWKAILSGFFRSFLSFWDLSFNDLFIPWKSSRNGAIMTKRYYHNFLPFEIKALVKKSGFRIIKAFPVKKGKITSFLNSYNYILIARNER